MSSGPKPNSFDDTYLSALSPKIDRVESIEIEISRINRSIELINNSIRSMNHKLENNASLLERMYAQQELYHSLGKWIINNVFPILSAVGSLILLAAKFFH